MPPKPKSRCLLDDSHSEPANGGRMETYQLARRASRHVLAVGGELKSAFCLYAGREAALSEPLGHLTDPRAYRDFIDVIEEAKRRCGFRPAVIAHDLHPLYMSTRYALGTGLPTVAVQHHHAHVVSVMAEWRVDKPVVGICCDGVGYGVDGAAWGCEVLRCDASGFTRAGHLEYFPLIGGDAAAVETCRPAAALLRQAFGDEWRDQLATAFCRVPEKDLDAFERLMTSSTKDIMTSSLGRVFDGVSFLLGLCDRNEHEAQASIALDSAASAGLAAPYPYGTTADNGLVRMSVVPVVRAIVQDLKAGVGAGAISARFHETVARMLAATAEMVCEMEGISTTALSGGCFANRRLASRVTERLERRHLRVLRPRRVSCGDAGLALGQAVIAAAKP
ncbi:MAG: carbamoyltransferase HypF [Phycisphaerae bacterium]|nr:carbamoyltransferase HypF [Phycisphaerae bacterium]